ncbi:MAG: ATP-dependent helicase HrpB [Acidimicrobiales bacterium]|nr:MAG: ATP-dependent helicase HrpB [Acidimicrobiales bacterium]
MFLAETDLPIETVIPEVRSALQDPGVAVLTAEPGAGKTTIVPLRLLDEPWAASGSILVLEPRRVAARSVARRMAQLCGESVGDTVGWRTRDDVKVSARTRVEVITEGILTRRLQNDPSLPGVAAVIFDEFHERSVHADLGLALTLEAREAIRPDLRLLIMSATIDAAAVADLVGQDGPSPVIECEGRTHPIDVRWRPRGKKDRLEPAVVAAVEEALEHPGDVLVFLPGMAEIRRSVDALASRLPHAVRPLYGALSAEEQDEALRGVSGSRRIVVSTDVAETSLTVDGIGSVVDSGLARRPRYDPATGLSKLVTIDNSRSSADQRAGRAGRLGPGVAIRLWSKMEHAARPRHEQPEILQIDLASVLLESLAWGVSSPNELRLLDHPKEASVTDAREVLEMLGAIDDGSLSADGRRMLRLPLHPRLAAMVSAVGDGPLGWPASVLAALMTERDVLRGRPSERPTDLWPRVQLVADEGFHHVDADGGAIRTVRRVARDVARRAGASESPISPDDLGRCLALAYPDRIAQKRAGQGGRFRMRNGMGAEVDKTDPMAHEAMLVIAEVSGDKRNVRIRRAAGIDPLDIELGFATDMDERTLFGWDDDRDDLVERVERRLGSLDFGTHERPAEPSERTTEALIDRIVDTGLDVLTWTDAARNLQQRVELVARERPELIEKTIDDTTLRKAAADVFGPYLVGATSRRDVEALDITSILRDRLGWNTVSSLDRLAPVSFSLPKGRTVAVDYTAESPRVSVRAQDAFGIETTPMIVDGSVPLTFELLSPANRPIQITSDLAAFWEGSWAEVRKDMVGRYPKHDWPEHPQSPS